MFNRKFIAGRDAPHIPKPAPREEPVVEELTHPAHDTRPVAIKQQQRVLLPKFNKLYGSLRTENGWQNEVTNYAKGTLTTVAGSQVSAAVSLLYNNSKPNWRLEQWPGGVLLYLVIRGFSIAPSTATFATIGDIDLYFQDTSGQIIPLGVCINNDEITQPSLNIIVPSPITDPDNAAVGSILATLDAGATVGTYNWQMAFSGAYLAPAENGYIEVDKYNETPLPHMYHEHH